MTSHPIPDAALAQHTALLGKTGSGKTYAAKGVVERLLARGERVAIVDPTGVYWGLRLDAKGKKASPFEIVIFGGRHADLPLAATDGERLAEIVGTSATPVILDTQLMSVGARTQFFTAFAEGLLRHNRGPLHLVLDEAHLFAPQGGSLGFDKAQMLHATNNLVSLGRSAGLRIMMISQRPAKLHKDSLTQVETLVALRLIAPPDRKAVKDWLDGAPDKSRGDEIMASLASLPQGTGWIYAPEQGVLVKATFPAIQTFDSGRPLESGEAPVLKPIDVASIKAALSVVPRAKPDQLTQAPLRIVGETQAARSGSAVDLAAAERRGHERGYAAGRNAGYADGLRDGFAEAVNDARRAIEALTPNNVSTDKAPAVAKRAPPAAPKPVESRPTPPPRADGAGLSPTARRILDVIEAAHPVSMTFKAAALRAGASPRSSQFRQYEREIMVFGAVERLDGNRLRARRAGGPSLAVADPVETFAAKIAPSWAAMLRTIASAPEPLTKDAVAAGAGVSPTSSGLTAGLKELCAMELIEKANGAYRLADAMR